MKKGKMMRISEETHRLALFYGATKGIGVGMALEEMVRRAYTLAEKENELVAPNMEVLENEKLTPLEKRIKESGVEIAAKITQPAPESTITILVTLDGATLVVGNDMTLALALCMAQEGKLKLEQANRMGALNRASNIISVDANMAPINDTAKKVLALIHGRRRYSPALLVGLHMGGFKITYGDSYAV